jgi:hypothetical protein
MYQALDINIERWNLYPNHQELDDAFEFHELDIEMELTKLLGVLSVVGKQQPPFIFQESKGAPLLILVMSP